MLGITQQQAGHAFDIMLKGRPLRYYLESLSTPGDPQDLQTLVTRLKQKFETDDTRLSRIKCQRHNPVRLADDERVKGAANQQLGNPVYRVAEESDRLGKKPGTWIICRASQA